MSPWLKNGAAPACSFVLVFSEELLAVASSSTNSTIPSFFKSDMKSAELDMLSMLLSQSLPAVNRLNDDDGNDNDDDLNVFLFPIVVVKGTCTVNDSTK